MSRHKFPVGNNYGGRKEGSKNAINKTEAIKLVNMLLEDMTTNYDTLTTWQKLKLFGYMKDVLKETIVEPVDTGVKIPEVIFLNTVK